MRYTGGGYGGSLPGVPARDLSDEEVQQHGGIKALQATGLYACLRRQEPARGRKVPRENVDTEVGE
jgi:hypothetical protein